MNTKAGMNGEWLETNGIGGFASGSVNGAPNRRYHGLLCASLNPPTDRHLLVSHLIEKVAIGDQSFALSTEHYLNHRSEPVIQGAFTPYPYAHWHFDLPGTTLEKSVCMKADENTTFVRYENTGLQPLNLFLKPLVAARDYHALRNHEDPLEVNLEGNTVQIQFLEHPPIYIASSRAQWELMNHWYHELYYEFEAQRGSEAVEKNFSPAEMEVCLAPKEKLILRFSTQKGTVPEVVFKEKDSAYYADVQTDSFKKEVALAAQQFLVHRESNNGQTILAGYPWFTDWGRDTLMALRDFQDFMTPGEAQLIIKTFLQYQQYGLIPNRFPDNPEDEIEYNTVDATLWLFIAVWELYQFHPDTLFVEQIFADLSAILEAHLGGTKFNIEVDESGLLTAGEVPWQLTWMDAKIGDHVVTPRYGAPVEINCLWYNVLKIYQQLALKTHQQAIKVDPWIKKFEKSFSPVFWNPAQNSLFDNISSDGTPDPKIRPNQIYALSLPFSPLKKSQQKKVLQQISKKLYTPLGIRTLSMDEAEFRPFYEGDIWERDTAYHQGTVWPFLLREYWGAYEKINGSRKTKAALSQAIEPLKDHFYNDAGIGSVSEVFDGLEPKHGKGCPQQAWSVAALWYMLKKLD